MRRIVVASKIIRSRRDKTGILARPSSVNERSTGKFSCANWRLAACAASLTVSMATPEHTTRMVGQLIGLSPLLGRQQSVDFCERFSANRGHLSRIFTEVRGQLIDLRIGFAGLNGIFQSQPVLTELITHGLRGFA